MNHLKTTISEFIRDLQAQKLRAFMTTFGIVWGTVAIVVLLAFGMGFKKQLAINMHGIGERIAIMFPGSTTKAYEGFGVGRPISLVEEDAQLLKTQVANIDKISPEFSKNDYQMHIGQNFTNTAVAGIYPIYHEMRNIIPEPKGLSTISTCSSGGALWCWGMR
jgi:putative ABC transport system permease protein